MIHENTKLMINGAKLSDITNKQDSPINSYKECIARIICNPPLPSCYIGNCNECPGTSKLKSQLQTAFEEAMMDTVTYKQWIAADKTTLETIEKNTEEFIDVFIKNLISLKMHSFIATQQSQYYSEIKNNLKLGEFLVIADFSENYAFVVQDEVHGFHWNNNQATLHPFVIYYKADSSVQSQSFVIISDCLKHDSAAVHLFNRKLINFLNQNFDTVEKIYYFTDGAASHYKNKSNFINLCSHEEDFGVKAEWHFFATSHGKGPCDGVGGTIKRLAARTSLQRTSARNQILTPMDLFQWAQSNLKHVTFCYVTSNDYSAEVKFLEERFRSARTVPGTRTKHACIPRDKITLMLKTYSSAADTVYAKIRRD